MTAINLPLETLDLGQLARAPNPLLRKVTDQFRGNTFPPLRAIRCEVRGDLVILRGQVPTFYLKQMAQALTGKVSGVRRVVNEIEVVE